MSRSERRRAQRFKLHVSLRFQDPLSPLSPELSASTLDISSSGVCFTTNSAPSVGQHLFVRMKMPKRLMQRPPGEVCFTGRVARVELNGKGNDTHRVSVHFLCYEPSSPITQIHTTAKP